MRDGPDRGDIGVLRRPNGEVTRDMAKTRDRAESAPRDDPRRRRAAAEAERRLREHYELGVEALAGFPGDGDRDPATIARLADRRGVTRDLVWKAADFARRYTREELDELCRLRGEDSRMPLSFSHVRRLLAVKSRAKRARLQRRAAREGWTNEELAAEVIAVQGRRGHGGRAPSRPGTLRATLRQITARSEEWLRRRDKAWSDARIGQLASRGEGADQDLGGLTEELERVAESLRRIGIAARALEKRLRGIASKAGDAEIPGPEASGSGRMESGKRQRGGRRPG